MKITDYKRLIVERSNDFLHDNTSGIIVKTPDEIGQNVYGVYIGRLFNSTFTKEPFEEKVNLDTNKCLNSINKNIGNTSATSSNYIHLTMFSVYNLSMPRLIKGEKILIGMIDQDIKSIYIKPFCRDQIRNRPTDTLEMYVPASNNYDGNFLDDNDKYYLKLDSVNKNIRLHMSDAQGEVSKYDLIIDGNNGNISITDGSRSFTISTNNDEIFISNEAGSSIVIREDIIDMSCAKFYLKATESINIESPKMEAEIKDSTTLKTEKFTGEMTNVSTSGEKITEEYEKVTINTSNKREITCPKSIIDGLVSISDWLNANGGISFGGPTDRAPMPTVPQISSSGVATFAGAPSQMLAKWPPLMQLLTQIAIKLDTVGTNPLFPVPAPVIAPLITSLNSQIGSTAAKG